MTDPATERWLPVVGHEGLYEVSDLGRIRSLDRSVAARWGPGTRPVSGCMMTPREQNGYLEVVLSRYGTQKVAKVHRLVGEAFIGPLPPKLETRHGPGGKLDNRLANLCYGTRSENQRDRKRDGTARIPPRVGSGPRGETHPFAKLTAAIVADCRSRYAAGETQHSLASEFGVAVSAMHNAIHGKSWRRVT